MSSVSLDSASSATSRPPTAQDLKKTLETAVLRDDLSEAEAIAKEIIDSFTPQELKTFLKSSVIAYEAILKALEKGKAALPNLFIDAMIEHVSAIDLGRSLIHYNGSQPILHGVILCPDSDIYSELIGKIWPHINAEERNKSIFDARSQGLTILHTAFSAETDIAISLRCFDLLETHVSYETREEALSSRYLLTSVISYGTSHQLALFINRMQKHLDPAAFKAAIEAADNVGNNLLYYAVKSLDMVKVQLVFGHLPREAAHVQNHDYKSPWDLYYSLLMELEDEELPSDRRNQINAIGRMLT